MNNSEKGELVVFEVKDNSFVPTKKKQPALLFSNSREIFEEPTAFLSDHYCRSGRRGSPLTWKAAAHSLLSWFQFLQAIGCDSWRDASVDNLAAYRDAFSAGISPKTGSEYSRGTITNRMVVIIKFHDYARKQQWYSGSIASGVRLVEKSIPSAADPLAHTKKGQSIMRVVSDAHDLLPGRSTSATIKPFMPNEMQAFLRAIGPRASQPDGDSRPSRDRLIVDFGWAVGLRLDEIHQLTKYQFLSLSPDTAAPAGHQVIVVFGKGSKGSGKKPRSVAIPNWLVIDALAYIEGERAAAIRKANIKGRSETPSLIVSGQNANVSGKQMTHRRFQQIVQEACLSAGLVEYVPYTNVETGEVTHRIIAKHSVHDLRHTYAVYTYWAERKAGNSEPWKKIQAQLGHAFLSITINIYLRWTEILDNERTVDLRSILGY